MHFVFQLEQVVNTHQASCSNWAGGEVQYLHGHNCVTISLE